MNPKLHNIWLEVEHELNRTLPGGKPIGMAVEGHDVPDECSACGCNGPQVLLSVPTRDWSPPAVWVLCGECADFIGTRGVDRGWLQKLHGRRLLAGGYVGNIKLPEES